ncbi:MAG: Ig-like domain-containing protein, partial [Candidatus Eisenbacteria bacterium]
MLGCTRLICGTAAVLLAGAGLFENALGRPNIRQSFFNAYPQAVGSRLDNLPSIQGHCGVCHYAFTGGGTRNAFGVALGNVLGNFPNNDAGRQAAIHSIENEDSDSDGYAQLVEITDTQNYDNTPTFPGLTPANVGQVSQVDPADILGYLVPSSGTDTEPPDVVLLTPNGGEVWTAGTVQTISWIATDDTEVSTVDLSYRDHGNEAWHFLARRLSNTGSLTWSVPNLPSTDAAVRIQARDLAGNVGSDESDQPFTILPSPGGTVPTTLRDFEQPGSQPFDAEFFSDRTACSGCHGGYDPAVEPDHGFQGSMMAQAARDPLFFACLTIAEQDAPSSGDLCLRCHTPFGWLGGRSNPTTGELLTASDRDGVSCHFCHRMVDPIYDSGIDPPEDVDVLAGIADVPGNYANGQYVADPEDRRRGPFEDAAAPHTFLASAFHRSSDFCGTCHDVSNPVFERVGGSDYAPGPLDEPPNDFDSSVLLPLERTYSEWKNSEFATTGVYAPEFAGNKPDGIVSTCQDCHMADAQGRGCNVPGTPLRDDLPRHDLTGGNAWVPSIVEQAYPGEVDAQALADGAQRAISMLERAALLDVAVDPEPNGYLATVTITNRSGHKLPTGYPEGRRMWVSLAAYDAADQIIYESGAYDPGTGILVEDDDLALYEAKMGISPALAGALGLPAGASFHFTL